MKEQILKLNIEKSQDHDIWSQDFMANGRGKVEAMADFLSLRSKITEDGDCSREIRR